jgi:hypothetical protein
MKGLRQNERLINNPLIRMLAILINLVWLFYSYFHSHFTPLHFWMFCYNMIVPCVSPTDNGDTITVFTSKNLHTPFDLGILAHYAIKIKKTKEYKSGSLLPSSPFVSTFLHTILPYTGRGYSMLLNLTYYQFTYNELLCQSPISTIVLTICKLTYQPRLYLTL